MTPRHPRQRAFALALILLVASLPGDARQGAATAETGRVLAEKLTPGAIVVVTMKAGTRVRGEFVAVTADAVQVRPRRAGPAHSLPLSEITWIELQPQQKVGARTLAILWKVGVAAAAVFGLMLLIQTVRAPDYDESVAPRP